MGFVVALNNPQNYPEQIINKFTQSQNVYITGWVPQSVLLKDDRVRFFFTHGGMNSYYEGVEGRKTMIIMPFDQDE